LLLREYVLVMGVGGDAAPLKIGYLGNDVSLLILIRLFFVMYQRQECNIYSASVTTSIIFIERKLCIRGSHASTYLYVIKRLLFKLSDLSET
jgi:hypothetical protein